MKIAIAQPNTIIGDCVGNIQSISELVKEAISQQCDLIIFPELSVIGYPPEDLLTDNALIEDQFRSIEPLYALSMECPILLGLALPVKDYSPKHCGHKPLYNSAVLLKDGLIAGYQHKTLLPDYDVFFESRYFQPADQWNVMDIKGIRFGVTICEDIWDDTPPPLYSLSPLNILSQQDISFFINISASPFGVQKYSHRETLFKNKCLKHRLPGLYINQTGCHTELLFDGRSFAKNKNGDHILELSSFKQDIGYVVFRDGDLHPFEREKTILPTFVSERAYLLQALEEGIKDYFIKNGFTQAVVGSSGGVDSALVQTIASRALGAQHVTALIMPSEFTSQQSIDDAIQLSEHLGNPYHVIPIESLFQLNCQTLEGVYGKTTFDVTEENLQSRIRAILLMGYSNKKGHLLLNTSNKSELSVGYGTLYGDMCGALSIIGDVYKTEVYALCHEINRHEEIIPLSILNKPPSAELRPDQKDSDSLPDYGILDQILFHYIEQHLPGKTIVEKGFDPETVKKVLHLVRISEYKRYQCPPVLKVTCRTFGKGRLIPLTRRLQYEWHS
jgi:NAD+ synthase (glutamine-hydrolysing)